MTSRLTSIATHATALLAAIWAGLVVGVSFIATPVKFSAPTLELVPAIDVGRVTFALLNQVEWWLAGLTLILALLAHRAMFRLILIGLAVAVVLFQTFWLLPILDARSVAFVAGEPLPPSFHHAVFGVVESLKVLALVFAAIAYGRAVRQTP